MCGIVGIVGDLAFKDEATMKRLFVLDYFRGTDSTGLAAVRANGDFHVAKLSSHPLDLFEFPKFKSALNGNQSKVFIGHNRAATLGAVTSANAHPFEFDHIVGAHNGTLDFNSVRALEEATGERFDVDSKLLFCAIAKLGIEETIKLCFEGKESAKGAWSIVWYNKEDDTINFLRNKHRPMWIAWESGYKRLFFASEWQMIEYAHRESQVGYEAITVEKRGKNAGRYWATDEDVWYSWKLGDILSGGEAAPKAKAKKLKGKEPAAAASSYNPFQREGVTTNGNSGQVGFHTPKQDLMIGVPSSTTSSSTTTSHHSNNPKKPAIVTLIGDIANPLAGYFTEAKFTEMAQWGCSFCQSKIEYGDPGIVIIERDNMVVCADCAGAKATDIDTTRILVPQKRLEALA